MEFWRKRGIDTRMDFTKRWNARNAASRRSFAATSFAQSMTQKAGWIARAEPVPAHFSARRSLRAGCATAVSLHRQIQLVRTRGFRVGLARGIA